ncbi:protein NETWORKED 3A-like [Telopea speciosissima]|uniref:protein NETWORKED 3A-like n=1 Tax=Telopea speciosissima TaxID=54955 RepID=UPI001CC4F957|nr:protein NETWORKED 3A-like [Telopea speciosissima]
MNLREYRENQALINMNIGERRLQIMSTMENKINTYWQLRQSQWLLNTLSDLDEKILAMITIIQEEENSLIQRDEMYQKKTLELIEMGKEFHKSYHLFAEAYDQLSFESTEPIQSKSLSFKNNHSTGKGVIGSNGDFQMGSFEKENMWHELSFQVFKLIAENQSQQAELISRNSAKRETIKDLNCNLEKQLNENKVLHAQLRFYRQVVNKNQSLFSKLKRLILGKFLRVDTQ